MQQGLVTVKYKVPSAIILGFSPCASTAYSTNAILDLIQACLELPRFVLGCDDYHTGVQPVKTAYPVNPQSVTCLRTSRALKPSYDGDQSGNRTRIATYSKVGGTSTGSIWCQDPARSATRIKPRHETAFRDAKGLTGNYVATSTRQEFFPTFPRMPCSLYELAKARPAHV